MSEIMRGSKRWKLTTERALRILEKMDVSPREKNYLKVLMGESPSIERKTLSTEDYDTLADWTYVPILMSFDVSTSPWSIEEKARRFGVSEEKVKQVVDDLLRRGLLESSPDGGLRRVDAYGELSDDAPKELVRKFEEASLELSKKALEEIPPDNRHFTTMTFAGSRKKMELLRQEIRQFHDKARALMDCDECDEVYRINISLFPFDFTKKTS